MELLVLATLGSWPPVSVHDSAAEPKSSYKTGHLEFLSPDLVFQYILDIGQSRLLENRVLGTSPSVASFSSRDEPNNDFVSLPTCNQRSS